MQRIPLKKVLTGLLFIALLYPPSQANTTKLTRTDSLQFLLSFTESDNQRIKILFRLANKYVNGPLTTKNSLDTALIYIEQAESLSRQYTLPAYLEKAYFLKGKVLIQLQHTDKVLHMLARVKDTTRIKLLFELGKNLLRPTYSREANLDSAMFFFRKAEKLSITSRQHKWKEESHSLLGAAYVLKGDWPQAKKYFMQVIEARRQAGDKSGEMKAWLRMATITFCDSCQENLHFLQQALYLSRQIKDKAYEAHILLEMGYKYLHIHKGQTGQAKIYARQALKIQQAIGYPAIYRTYHARANESVYHLPSDYGFLSNAYYLLSDISQTEGDLNWKLLYILEIVKEVEENHMLSELDYSYYRLGNAYWELGLFKKSTAYHQQSLACSRQKGLRFVHPGLIRRMALSLIKQKKPAKALQLLQSSTDKYLPLTYEGKSFFAQSFGECYQAMVQHRQAEAYYLQSIAWSRHCTLQFQHTAWKGISQFYVDNAQYAKADPYVNKLLAASPEQVIPSHMKDVHLMRFRIDSAGGNYPVAIKHFQRYKALSDSIFNEAKSKQIAQLSIQYETEKKEQALLLKDKDIALLIHQAKVQQTQRNALIGGTGLLLTVLSLVYNRYLLKRRSNRQLQIQQNTLQAQHEELQAQQEELKVQQEELQVQQREIHLKNQYLSQLNVEKDSLLVQKDTLIAEKDQLIEEKKWLLKEIHHRVKNNLQIVMSLLNSQAASLQDKAALSAIKESQHRIQAMALIHQKLYRAEGVARIQMPPYIEEVINYLQDSYQLPQLIRFHLDIDPSELDVTLAVPLGLIINEAVTNAFKYAFPDNRSGTVSLSFHRIGAMSYALTIADDGIGLPAGYNPSQSRSLGMTLMHGFSEQIGGELQITSQAGLFIKVLFSTKPSSSDST